MRVDRRSFLGGLGAGLAHAGIGAAAAEKNGKSNAPRVTGEELDRAAAVPVLKLDGLTSPVIIDSVELLKKDREYFVRVRSKDGAEGMSVTNPRRAEYLDKIFKQLSRLFSSARTPASWKTSCGTSIATRTTTSSTAWRSGVRRPGSSSRSSTCSGGS